MIVADTNLIAYLLIPGPFSKDAERVQRRDPDWRAPWLWRSEFLNVLSLYVRTGKVTLAAERNFEAAGGVARDREAGARDSTFPRRYPRSRAHASHPDPEHDR